MQQHGSKYFYPQYPPHPNENSTLSEHGHVLYQIKWNRDAATWKQIFCLLRPPPPPRPWVGSKGQNPCFQIMVMLHIKLKGITPAAT